MSHSVFFFAIPEAAEALQKSAMLDKAVEWLDHSPTSVSRHDVARMKRLAMKILNDPLPKECGHENFDAILAIARSNFEELSFAIFCDYRDQSFPESIGLIMPGSRNPAPFPVPKSSQHYPRTGFVPWEQLTDFDFQPGGPVAAANDLASLEDELASAIEQLGLGSAVSLRGQLTGNVDKALVEETREDLIFAFERLAADRMSLFFVAT